MERKQSRRQSQPELVVRLTTAINKAATLYLLDDKPSAAEPLAQLEHLLSTYAALRKELEAKNEQYIEVSDREKSLAIELKRASDQLEIALSRERKLIEENEKLKLKVADTQKMFEQHDSSQQECISKLQQEIKNLKELGDLKKTHEQLREEHDQLVRLYDKERQQWETVKSDYENYFKRHQIEKEAALVDNNFTSSELENDPALKADWGEFESKPLQPPSQPEELLEENHFHSCPESHRELQERCIKTERALGSIESQLTETNRQKQQLAQESSGLKLETVRLSEELASAREREKQLEISVKELKKELEKKQLEILLQKDKKHKYKTSLVEERARRQEASRLYNYLMDVNEERVRSEYETPGRVEESSKMVSPESSPNKTPQPNKPRKTKQENEMNLNQRSQNRSLERKSNQQRKGLAILKQFSIKVSMTPYERSPMRSETESPRAEKPKQCQFEEHPVKESPRLKRQLMTVATQTFNEPVMDMEIEDTPPNPMPPMYRPPKRTLSMERNTLGFHVAPDTKSKPDKEIVAKAEPVESHSQTEQILYDPSVSRVYGSPARLLDEEHSEPSSALRVDYDRLMADMIAMTNEKERLEDKLGEARKQIIELMATVLQLELGLRDEKERNSEHQNSQLSQHVDRLVGSNASHNEEHTVQELTAVVRSLRDVNAIQERKLQQNRELHQRIRAQLNLQTQLLRKFRAEDKLCRSQLARLENEHVARVADLNMIWSSISEAFQLHLKEIADKTARERKELEQRLAISEQSLRIIDGFREAADRVQLNTDHLTEVEEYKQRKLLDNKLIEMLEILLQGVTAKAQFANRSRALEKLDALRRASSASDKSNLLSELLVELTTYTGELVRP